MQTIVCTLNVIVTLLPDPPTTSSLNATLRQLTKDKQLYMFQKSEQSTVVCLQSVYVGMPQKQNGLASVLCLSVLVSSIPTSLSFLNSFCPCTI